MHACRSERWVNNVSHGTVALMVAPTIISFPPTRKLAMEVDQSALDLVQCLRRCVLLSQLIFQVLQSDNDGGPSEVS